VLAEVPLASGLVPAAGGGDPEPTVRTAGFASWAGGLALAALMLPFGLRAARSRRRRD
jgi:ABC-type phosphate transport system permease subunit